MHAQTSKEEMALICPEIGSSWSSSGNCECGIFFHHRNAVVEGDRIANIKCGRLTLIYRIRVFTISRLVLGGFDKRSAVTFQR